MSTSLGIRGRVIGLAMVPMAIIGVLLLFQLITGKIDDLDQSLRTRAVAIARQLAPAAEYGVASGNIEVLQTLLEKVAIEPDIRGVAVFSDNGQRLAQVGLGTWTEPAQGRLPADRTPSDRIQGPAGLLRADHPYRGGGGRFQCRLDERAAAAGHPDPAAGLGGTGRVAQRHLQEPA